MSRINLGEGVSLDLGILLRTRMLIAASSGGGKSYTLRRMLEQSSGKVQQIILDYEGEFATLREKFDYVLVGKGGEIATDTRYAPQLAKRLLELNVSAVIDLYELKADERKKFVKIFLEALINLPKDLWKPCMVVVDEAHVFCPEKGKGESEASGAVIDLASRGRKRGYCAVLATQDIAKLNKDASGECRNRLIGLAVEDKTRERSAGELGMTDKAQILGLRNLEPGEFYAFGPAIANEVKRVRIGSIQTSHPEVSTKKGRARWAAPPPPREKVKAILSKLEDLPKDADEEFDTIRGLRAQVTDLKRQLATRPAPVVQSAPEVQRKIVEVPVLKDGQVARLEKAVTKVLGIEQLIKDSAAEIVAALKAAQAIDKNAYAARLTITPLASVKFDRPRKPVTVTIPHGTGKSASNGDTPGDKDLRSGERRMLQTLAQRYPLKLTRSQLGTLSGFTPSGGTFGQYFGTIRKLGYITERNDDVEITEEGLAYLGSDVPPSPNSTDELIEMWRKTLRAGEQKMLDEVVRRFPHSISREELGSVTGFTASGGTFGQYLGTLKRNGLVETMGDQVIAGGALFLEGVRP